MMQSSAPGPSARIELDGEDPGRALAGVVLAVVELLRQLLERQAVRRVAASSLSDDQVEQLGTALAKLERAVRQLADDCRVDPAEVRALADHLIDVNTSEGDR